jgi:hypothetical protein
VLNHLPRDPGYILYLPCEEIQIFPKKSDERGFQFGFQFCADPELLVQIARVNWDFLIISLLLPVRRLIDGLLVGR